MTYLDHNKQTFTYRDVNANELLKDTYSRDTLESHLADHPEIVWVSIPHTHIGYGAGIMEYSNHDYFINNFPGLVENISCEIFVHFSTVLAAGSELLDEDGNMEYLMEQFASLYEYPIIDESDYDQRESESFDEALRDELGYLLPDLDTEQISEAFNALEESSYDYCETEGDHVYIAEAPLVELAAKIATWMENN